MGIMLDEHFGNSKQTQKLLQHIPTCWSMGKTLERQLLLKEMGIFSPSIWVTILSCHVLRRDIHHRSLIIFNTKA